MKVKGERWTPYAYLAPALISITVLSLMPTLWSVYISFTNYSLYNFKKYQLVGLENFKTLLVGPMKSLFFPLLGWNLVFAAAVTFGALGLGLFLAILLNNPHLKEAALYRGLLIIPWAMPSTVTLLVWKGMFNESFGPVNAFLRSMGFEGLPFFTDPLWARLMLIVVSVWFAFPYFMSLCSGALLAIPHELYEAADIDGANWWARFRYVTVPGIWAVAGPMLVSSFAFNFNNFGAAYLITTGGPHRLESQYAGYTDILASFNYKLTMQYNQYALASAMGIILFMIIAALSLYQIRVMIREVQD